VSASDQQTLYEGCLMAYICVGRKHKVAGYNHLLFLAEVIFFSKNFWDILLFITAFTPGHCITLISATYLGLKADEHLTDAVIALSVI
jgi:hypothetical protein